MSNKGGNPADRNEKRNDMFSRIFKELEDDVMRDFMDEVVKESTKTGRHADLVDGAKAMRTIIEKYDDLDVISGDMCNAYLGGMNKMFLECMKKILFDSINGHPSDLHLHMAKFSRTMYVMSKLFYFEFSRAMEMRFTANVELQNPRKKALCEEMINECEGIFSSLFPVGMIGNNSRFRDDGEEKKEK